MSDQQKPQVRTSAPKQQQKSPATETAEATPKAGAPLFERAMKGHRVHHSDKFKLLVANRQFNDSYIKYQPRLVAQEHSHFFRSCDETGKKNQFSTYMGNHFHEVKLTYDKDGNVVKAECGPALHKATITMPGSKKKVQRVTPIFFEAEDTNTGTIEKIYDNHTHEVEYLHTEEVSQEIRRRTQTENANKVKQAMSERAFQKMADSSSQPAPTTPDTNLEVIE